MIEGNILGLVCIITFGFSLFFLFLVGYGIKKCCEERFQENNQDYSEILSPPV